MSISRESGKTTRNVRAVATSPEWSVHPLAASYCDTGCAALDCTVHAAFVLEQRRSGDRSHAPACCAQNTKADIVVSVFGRVPVAICRAGVSGVIVPGPPTQNATGHQSATDLVKIISLSRSSRNRSELICIAYPIQACIRRFNSSKVSIPLWNMF